MKLLKIISVITFVLVSILVLSYFMPYSYLDIDTNTYTKLNINIYGYITKSEPIDLSHIHITKLWDYIRVYDEKNVVLFTFSSKNPDFEFYLDNENHEVIKEKVEKNILLDSRRFNISYGKEKMINEILKPPLKFDELMTKGIYELKYSYGANMSEVNDPSYEEELPDSVEAEKDLQDYLNEPVNTDNIKPTPTHTPTPSRSLAPSHTPFAIPTIKPAPSIFKASPMPSSLNINELFEEKAEEIRGKVKRE